MSPRSDHRPPTSGEPSTEPRFEDVAPDGRRISDVGGESALIATLSDAMAEKLARNRGKRHWNDAAPTYLIERLRQEVDELEQAIGGYLEEGSADENDVWAEAADVANFAAMLADNATGRAEAAQGAAPLDMSCDRIVNNGMGEPTECGRSYPCDLHDEWAAPRTAAEWHRYLHQEGMLVADEGEECGPWHHRVFIEGAAPRAEGLDKHLRPTPDDREKDREWREKMRREAER